MRESGYLRENLVILRGEFEGILLPMSWETLQESIVECTCCARLRRYCQEIAIRKRKAFQNETYWGKPVPNFGDTNARLLIVGLAPAAHGGNRTGRIFTGDASGDFLFEALYRTGFANQPTSRHRYDGLKLQDALITATVHCAPPDNKPTPEEQTNCFPYLVATYRLLHNLQGMLALGQIAFSACLRLARSEGLLSTETSLQFRHGAIYSLAGGRFLAVSYHPSARNTYTKLLTMEMMTHLLEQIKQRLR